mmetsp:Transcript_11309/g.25068  ORF Transcript_11309/g.25068 Transcript_11309/m.25068 type:complete len:284 (+) Transcript_11309:764-1615(+)
MHPGDALRDILELAFPQQLSLSQLINAQILTNRGKQLALEGEQTEGHVIDRRGMNQLQIVPFIVNVCLDGSSRSMPRMKRHVIRSANHEARLVGQLVEIANCHADGSFIDVQVQLGDSVLPCWVHYSDAAAPLPFSGLERANLRLGQVVLLVFIGVVRPGSQLDLLQCCSDLTFGLFVISVVVCFKNCKHDCFVLLVQRLLRGEQWRWERHKASRGVRQRHHSLIEDLSESITGHNPQLIVRNRSESFGALLRGEGASKLKLVVRHRGAVVLPLEIVAQPRLR